MTYTHL